MPESRSEIVRRLLDEHGRTYAEQAGITMRDKPSPLYRLLVLSLLLSARIGSDIAVAAARELSAAGLRTPQRMAAASWQDRVDALGRGRYRRYDERTATMLGDGADLLNERYHGDLRRLRGQASGVDDLLKRLQQFPGIGPGGASIFAREVQAVWPELAPYVDERAANGAAKLGLPTSPDGLAKLVDWEDFPRLVAGLVRITLRS